MIKMNPENKRKTPGRIWLTIWVVMACFTINIIIPIIIDAQVSAANNKRRMVKSKMTNNERKAYRQIKNKLAVVRRSAKTKQKIMGHQMLSAIRTAYVHGRALDKARVALMQQKSRLNAAETKTGPFKPSQKKIESMRNKYNRSADIFNKGPLSNYRDKKAQADTSIKDFRASNKEVAKAVGGLAKHRLAIGGRMNQLAQAKAARQENRGSFMKLGSNTLRLLNYDKIPDLSPEGHYTRAPARAQIYGPLPSIN